MKTNDLTLKKKRKLSQSLLKNILMVYEFGSRETLEKTKKEFRNLGLDPEQINIIVDDEEICVTWEEVLKAREYIKDLKKEKDE